MQYECIRERYLLINGKKKIRYGDIKDVSTMGKWLNILLTNGDIFPVSFPSNNQAVDNSIKLKKFLGES